MYENRLQDHDISPFIGLIFAFCSLFLTTKCVIIILVKLYTNLFVHIIYMKRNFMSISSTQLFPPSSYITPPSSPKKRASKNISPSTMSSSSLSSSCFSSPGSNISSPGSSVSSPYKSPLRNLFSADDNFDPNFELNSGNVVLTEKVKSYFNEVYMTLGQYQISDHDGKIKSCVISYIDPSEKLELYVKLNKPYNKRTEVSFGEVDPIKCYPVADLAESNHTTGLDYYFVLTSAGEHVRVHDGSAFMEDFAVHNHPKNPVTRQKIDEPSTSFYKLKPWEKTADYFCSLKQLSDEIKAKEEKLSYYLTVNDIDLPADHRAELQSQLIDNLLVEANTAKDSMKKVECLKEAERMALVKFKQLNEKISKAKDFLVDDDILSMNKLKETIVFIYSSLVDFYKYKGDFPQVAYYLKLNEDFVSKCQAFEENASFSLPENTLLCTYQSNLGQDLSGAKESKKSSVSRNLFESHFTESVSSNTKKIPVEDLD